MTSLEQRYLDAHPLWTPWQRYPAVQRRWRAKISSTELRIAPEFGPMRAAIRHALENERQYFDSPAKPDSDGPDDATPWTPAEDRKWGSLNWTVVLRRAARVQEDSV